MTLEECVRKNFSSYTADELRAAYWDTPAEIKSLFAKNWCELPVDAWLIIAIEAGDVHLYEVPAWVSEAVTIWFPRLRIDPWKSAGFWRLNYDSWERHYSTADLVRWCRK